LAGGGHRTQGPKSRGLARPHTSGMRSESSHHVGEWISQLLPIRVPATAGRTTASNDVDYPSVGAAGALGRVVAGHAGAYGGLSIPRSGGRTIS
ncbi:MAG: hypothetical protein ACK53Y_09075, partial [bacterium]